ncbi:hypothetical protein Lal_00045839 [Lupinus albus]|nr:hypothetical protein Lal_00045839 [Lupinus albus]
MVKLMKLRQKEFVSGYHEDSYVIITRLDLDELRHYIQLMIGTVQPRKDMKPFTPAKLYEATNTQLTILVLPNKLGFDGATFVVPYHSIYSSILIG